MYFLVSDTAIKHESERKLNIQESSNWQDHQIEKLAYRQASSNQYDLYTNKQNSKVEFFF